MRSQRRTRRLAVALIGSATLALTACGGGGSDDAAQPESASQEPSTPADSGADPFDLTRQAAAHMPMTADALATGFDSALKLPGNAGSDAAGLRAQLTYLLTEGQEFAASVNYAPLPADLRDDALVNVEAITAAS